MGEKMFAHNLGDGVELRILEVRHAKEFLAFVECERAFLGKWLTWAITITSVEAAENFLRRGTTRFVEDGLPWVGIWQDGGMVGGVLFFPIDKTINATEVGYWLAQTSTGRGLITRATAAMLEHAFLTVGVNRVGLSAEVGNEPSIAVANRLGFTREGIRRSAWKNGGKYVDMVGFSMLAHEWRANPLAKPPQR
jgi:ribosomal-protein-serine acetyltransferase